MSLKTKFSPQTISSWFAFLAQIAFAITVVLIPFRARYVFLARPTLGIYKDFTDFCLFFSDVSMFFLLLFWGISLIAIVRPIKPGPKVIWIPLLALLFCSLISVPTSLDAALSFYYLFRFIVLFLFYLYIVNEVHSVKVVIVLVILQIGFQAIIGLLQFFVQGSVRLQFLGEHILDPKQTGVSVLFDGSTRLLRAYGLTEHPNILGGCLAFGLILLAGAYLYSNKRVRLLIAVLFLTGLAALFVTFSRSAWLGLFIGLFLLGAYAVYQRQWEGVRSFLLLGLVGVVVMMPLVWANLNFLGARVNIDDSFEKNPIETNSINERVLLNHIAMDIFVNHPLTGVGVGSSPLAVKATYANIINHFVPPHFVFLAVADETGLAGAIFYLVLSIGPWVALAKKMRKTKLSPLLIVISAVLLAITVISLFDIYPWFIPAGRLWQWLAWGLWAVAYEDWGRAANG